MESSATTIRFVTLDCRALSSELQQTALSRHLRYLCVPFAALEETLMRDRPVTKYWSDADEKKVGACSIAVRIHYNNLLEEFDSTLSRCAFLRIERNERKLWIVNDAPAETAEDNNSVVIYNEFNVLMSKIPSQQEVMVAIDKNPSLGLEQQSDVLGK
ncbi:hypothetical protein RB195_026283 [Necator americanus]